MPAAWRRARTAERSDAALDPRNIVRNRSFIEPRSLPTVWILQV
jgi:hypothetical protein